MQVLKIENTEGFDSLRGEWNALLERSSANGVFLTWEWLRTWWKHLAERRKLSILVLRNEGQLVGLAPLAIRPACCAKPANCALCINRRMRKRCCGRPWPITRLIWTMIHGSPG